jgi:RND family efflux transporter MFP subunit
VGLGALFAGLFYLGWRPRAEKHQELAAEARDVAARVPEVRILSVRRAPGETTVTLPGTTQAHLETPLYARVNGYLKKFHVDIGDPVRKGQLVAEIESPEIDQELRQARAALAVAHAALGQSQANLTLARIAAKRWQTLAKDHAVSQQEADEKQATLEAREADVESGKAAILAQEANVRRLEELQSFEQITAPFEGVVTSRTVDVGTLVSLGSTTGTRELFRLAQVDSLRLFVPVPESHLAAVAVGLPTRVHFEAYPGREFSGSVSRSARAIDPSSRTMLTEVTVPNPEGLLVSGMYAKVTFHLRREAPPLLMSSNALIVRPEGTLVARVSREGAVHYQKIEVGRDFGVEVEVLSGLSEGDAVMVNPTTEVREGQKVRPAREK